eukprot:SAG11_NODE_285_length_11230_cov_6.339412_11_plen_156_part_00
MEVQACQARATQLESELGDTNHRLATERASVHRFETLLRQAEGKLSIATLAPQQQVEALDQSLVEAEATAAEATDALKQTLRLLRVTESRNTVRFAKPFPCRRRSNISSNRRISGSHSRWRRQLADLPMFSLMPHHSTLPATGFGGCAGAARAGA